MASHSHPSSIILQSAVTFVCLLPYRHDPDARSTEPAGRGGNEEKKETNWQGRGDRTAKTVRSNRESQGEAGSTCRVLQTHTEIDPMAGHFLQTNLSLIEDEAAVLTDCLLCSQNFRPSSIHEEVNCGSGEVTERRRRKLNGAQILFSHPKQRFPVISINANVSASTEIPCKCSYVCAES